MTSPEKTQVVNLAEAVRVFSDACGEKIVQKFDAESTLALAWLSYLNSSQRTGTADQLLDGATSSIKEGIACMALGLVRPALFSLRTHIDLVLAWLYFKDHPVEWKNLNDTGEGFKLKKEIIEYLSNNYSGFLKRHNLLREVIIRTTMDPYRLLSAHVHAQSVTVIPEGKNLADVVQEEKLALECSDLWREASEYVGDILASLFAPKWTALPKTVQDSIKSRLDSKKHQSDRFFEGI